MSSLYNEIKRVITVLSEPEIHEETETLHQYQKECDVFYRMHDNSPSAHRDVDFAAHRTNHTFSDRFLLIPESADRVQYRSIRDYPGAS